MAEQMQAIRKRMRGVESTERITGAMKLVSAAKLRRARSVYDSSKRYMDRLLDSMRQIFADTAYVPDRYLDDGRKRSKRCYVVITSSNGLCGSFNGNVIRAAEEALEAWRSGMDDLKMVTIGSKGREYFAHHGVEILMSHDVPADTVTFQETQAISGPLIRQYLAGDIDEINMIYTAYVNPLQQEVRTKRLLPLDTAAIAGEPAIDGLGQSAAERSQIIDLGVPRMRPAASLPSHNSAIDGLGLHLIEYEPSAEAVFDYLVPQYIELMLYSTCIESAACEYAARRTAMESANDNAREILDKLQLAYHHARQAQITDEIIEIVAGSGAAQ